MQKKTSKNKIKSSKQIKKEIKGVDMETETRI